MLGPGRPDKIVILLKSDARSIPVYFSRKASVEASRRRANLGSDPASAASRAECVSTRSNAGEKAQPRQHGAVATLPPPSPLSLKILPCSTRDEQREVRVRNGLADKQD